MKEKYYAVYKGDEFVCIGTLEECAKYMKVTKRTVSGLATPSYQKRVANSNNSKIAIVVEED